MREIKYRMWNKKEKKMYQVGVLDFDDEKAYIKNYLGYTVSNYMFEDIELMQYTGLKDKNGKEIYEGDIVKVEYQGEIEIYYVRYDESNACFRMFIKTDYFEEPFLDFAEDENELYEVIGNIYDTPELLKGEQS